MTTKRSFIYFWITVTSNYQGRTDLLCVGKQVGLNGLIIFCDDFNISNPRFEHLVVQLGNGKWLPTNSEDKNQFMCLHISNYYIRITVSRTSKYSVDDQAKFLTKRSFQNVSKTMDGVDCQKWTLTNSHFPTVTTANSSQREIGDHNYCRNPDDNPRGPWCITSDKDNGWDYCLKSCCPDTPIKGRNLKL